MSTTIYKKDNVLGCLIIWSDDIKNVAGTQ